MKQYVRYIKSIFLMKQVADEYWADTGGEKKPVLLTRRLWGTVITVAGGLLAVNYNVTVDSGISSQLLEHVMVVVNSVGTIVEQAKIMIPELMVIYGIIMGIVGVIGRR